MKRPCYRRGIVALALKYVKSWSAHASIVADVLPRVCRWALMRFHAAKWPCRSVARLIWFCVRRVLCLVLGCFVASSCGPRHYHPGIDLVCFDISNPGHTGQNDGTVGADPRVRYRNIYLGRGRLAPKVKVRAFGYDGAVVYQATPPNSVGDFNARIGDQLEQVEQALMPRPGTRTNAVLAESIADAIDADAKGQTSTIQIYTDGGIEDQGPGVIASIRDSVEKLRRLNHFQGLALIGCLPEHRRQWEQWLAPLADRGVVAGLTDADQRLADLAARIEVNP